MRTFFFIISIYLCTAISSAAQEPWPHARLDPKSYDPAVDVNTDMFIRGWQESPPRTKFGALTVHDIFLPSEGDPFSPERRGHIMTKFLEFAHAALESGMRTELSTLSSNQIVLYIYGGAGTITGGGKTYDLRDGIGVFVPEKLPFVMKNTGIEPLVMYLISEPVEPGFVPHDSIIIRDERDSRIGYTTGHWSHTAKGLFGKPEGDPFSTMNRIAVIWIDSQTFAQPHSHGSTFADEIWISLSGRVHAQLGKKLYELPPGSAYMVPCNGRTPHSNINVTDTPNKLIWFNMRIDGTEENYPFTDLERGAYDPEKDVSPDSVMSDWRDSVPRPLFGGMIIRNIFTPNHGDPMNPPAQGQVLKQLNYVSRGIVPPLQRTEPSTLTGEQVVFYVDSGTGTIHAGGKTAALRPGVGVLMPEGLEFTIDNETGSDPLAVYMFCEPAPEGFIPREDMLIRDENLLTRVHGGHWGNITSRLFEKEDGLATIMAVSPVWRDPFSIAQPHVSTPVSHDVVWLGLEGEINMLLGKQLRKLNPGAGFVNPGDGRFYHASVNVTAEPIKLFWVRANGPGE